VHFNGCRNRCSRGKASDISFAGMRALPRSVIAGPRAPPRPSPLLFGRIIDAVCYPCESPSRAVTLPSRDDDDDNNDEDDDDDAHNGSSWISFAFVGLAHVDLIFLRCRGRMLRRRGRQRGMLGTLLLRPPAGRADPHGLQERRHGGEYIFPLKASPIPLDSRPFRSSLKTDLLAPGLPASFSEQIYMFAFEL
jgi:hypothetical protein